MVNMLKSHTQVYRSVKERHPEHAVGLANNMFVFRPARRFHPLDRLTARIAHQNFNLGVLRYLAEGRFRFSFPGVTSLTAHGGNPAECDFFGVNYYTRFHMRFSKNILEGADAVLVPGPGPVTDMGWEVFPQGLSESLQLVARYLRVPIYVTENGIADARDVLRGEYIRAHVAQLDRSLADGLNVRGYFYWSLLDNFEWAHGFTKRFGLYHVDFATQVRTLRPGAAVLRDLLTARVVSHA
jgi:beta-glucosidase